MISIVTDYWNTATAGAKLYLLFSIGYFVFGALFLGAVWLVHKDLQALIDILRK